MRLHPILTTAAVATVASTFLLANPSTADGPLVPMSADTGHLVLQIEGDATALRVTAVTPKRSAYNPVTGTSPYAVALLDRTGKTLGSYPLDLSRFDLDAANIGKPPRVEGCVVWDTRIGTLTNIPALAATHSIEIRRGARRLGRLTPAALRRLTIAGGEPR